MVSLEKALGFEENDNTEAVVSGQIMSIDNVELIPSAKYGTIAKMHDVRTNKKYRTTASGLVGTLKKLSDNSFFDGQVTLDVQIVEKKANTGRMMLAFQSVSK